MKHDHELDRTEHTMSRLQPTQRRVGALPQSHPGLCGTLVGPGHPRYTSASTEEGRGWPDTSSTRRPLTNDNKTKTSFESNVLSGNRCGHTLGILHVCGACLQKPEIYGEMLSNSVNEHVVNKVEVETSRIIKKIAQRNETHHPGEDQPGDQAHQYSSESVH